MLRTGVNGLLIGQREPKEVESSNPFPNPGQARKVPSRTLARGMGPGQTSHPTMSWVRKVDGAMKGKVKKKSGLQQEKNHHLI